MGLDIAYYSKIQEVGKSKSRDDENIHIYGSSFTYQLGSLKENYSYSITEESESGSFRAGSYSGYNEWRNNLSIMAGYSGASEVWKDFNPDMRYHKLLKLEGKNVRIKPFYELIFFSDCEGYIGPEISKKLYQDFLDFDDKAKKFVSTGISYFYRSYQNWTECFRVASDNGIVIFC